MCGRFAVTVKNEILAEYFGLPEIPSLAPRYNIAPTQPVLAVCQNGHGERFARTFRWGLIPSWAKDQAMGARMINARCETVGEKPAFRGPVRYRRCLIPASGFFEWLRDGKARTPFYIRRADGEPLAFAGIWDTWKGPDGPVESCSILTTEPNSLVAEFHDRMPVILARFEFDAWLDRTVTDPERLRPLCRPFPSEQLEAVRVSSLVNDPRNDSPGCLEPER